MMVMSLAPIGVFCLISRTFATIGFSAFLPLAVHDRSPDCTRRAVLWYIRSC